LEVHRRKRLIRNEKCQPHKLDFSFASFAEDSRVNTVETVDVAMYLVKDFGQKPLECRHEFRVIDRVVKRFNSLAIPKKRSQSLANSLFCC